MKTIQPLAFIIVIVLLLSCSNSSSNKSDKKIHQQDQENQSKHKEKRTHENKKSEKLETRESQLAKVVGEYHLNSINGYMGASSMEYYNYENEGWIHTGYYITDSGENDYTNEISDELLSKLKTLKITIDEELSFSMSCLGEECLYEPFVENIAESESNSTTFNKVFFYFYVKGELTSEKSYGFDLLEGYGDIYTISYQKSNNSFELMVLWDDHITPSVATYSFLK
jgi:hypothetical protein